MKLKELSAAVQEAPYYSERFTRRLYTDAFREYTERFGPLYMAAVRETAADPNGRQTLAEALPKMDDMKKGELLGYGKAMVDIKKSEAKGGENEPDGSNEDID